MTGPPDLCWMFNIRPGYRMIHAENMGKTGGGDGPRRRHRTPTPSGPVWSERGVMSEASMRAYVPHESEDPNVTYGNEDD